MFDHDEVVIRTNNKVGKNEFWVMGPSFTNNIVRQIQESEDREIFRILDLLANNQE